MVSDFAQQIIGWIQDVALLLVLWLVSSIGGWLLYQALRWLMPDGLVAAVQGLMRFRASSRDAFGRFLKRLDELRGRSLAQGTARLVLERQHKALSARLTRIRSALDDKMMQLRAASEGGSATSLIELLQGFRRDVACAEAFGMLEDGMVDRSIAYNQARSRLKWSLVGSLIVGSFNAMLLYIFFREFESGVRIPFTRTDAIVIAPLLLPIAEFATGFFTDFLADSDKKTFGNQTTKWVVLIALASLEYFVFFLLFKNIFENAELVEYAGYTVPLLSLVGPGLALLQASIGSGAGRAMRMRTELATEQSIKTQISAANSFVDGLTARYGGIAAAARSAQQSIDQLATAVRGSETANLPVVSAVEEQRLLFLQAIDTVDPQRWSPEAPGGPADQDDVSRYAWLLPFALALLVTIFAWMIQQLIERLELFGPGAEWPRWAAAAGLAAVCFIAGGFMFDRVGVATQTNAVVRDTLFPRDELMRRAAIGAVLLAGMAIFSAAIIVDHGYGLVEGALATAFGAGICLLGSYPDLLAKGLSFLMLIALLAVIALLEGLWLLLQSIVLGLITLLAALAWFASIIIGAPLLLLIRYAQNRRPGTAAGGGNRTESTGAA